MSVAMLTLPRLAQLFAAVLYTPVVMCSSGAIHGAKRCRWSIYAAKSRSLIVKNPWVFSSVRVLACMAVLNVCRHTCHSPEWL